MKTSILFMGNGSCENGGCEAITKGTIETLKIFFQNTDLIDCFFDYTGKHQTNENKTIFPIHYPKRWTFKWCVLQFALKTSDTLTALLLYTTHKEEIRKSKVVLSLGGDNYSLDYGIPNRFIALGKYVKKQQIPFVIWGASIGPFVKGSTFEKKMASHLKNEVDYIFVREEESQKYLASIGVKENVLVVADPAFMMLPEECIKKLNRKLPERYICINFSDLMAKYVTNGNIEQWINDCATTIDMLSKESNLPLVFIPHVKADYEFMLRILPHMNEKENIVLINKNLTAAEMKWIISKAECNIACRTHSTIASFSTSVPTISLGYSIKSKGLNIQMYNHEKYLIYKTEITPEKILSVFKEIIKNDVVVREELREKNKVIKKQAIQAGSFLKELLNRNT